MVKDEAVLPADIKKEEIRKGPYPTKTPKKGDEVRIHYTGTRASDGFQFDSSYSSLDGKPYSFKLGIGAVMEAWDRCVATMNRGELSRFTIPEMYLSGGPAQFLDDIPEDCQVIYEIELLGVTSITDLFDDGGVVGTVLDDGEDYARPPKVGDEVQVDYELKLDNGQVVHQRLVDYKIGIPVADMPPAKVIDKALLNMKRQEIVSLQCRSEYAFGDAGNAELGIPPKAQIHAKLQLKEVYETEDVGKKVCWAEGLVVKKAIHVIKARLVPGMDGTRCTVKLLKITRGEEDLGCEETFEFVPGNGELCDALECACSRMRKGEKAIVTVNGPENLRSPGKPEGAAASGSGPVSYHLEMVNFDQPIPEDGPHSNSERLRFCAEQKERGTKHFRNGRYRLAQERYARIVELLPRWKREEGGSSVHVEFFEYEDDRKVAQELKLTCRLNLAACSLKLEEFYAASRHCSDVLNDDPHNIKALYRRAQGRLGSNDFDDATRDCKQILELEPGNKEAQQLIHKIARAAKEEAKSQRAQFGGKLLR